MKRRLSHVTAWYSPGSVLAVLLGSIITLTASAGFAQSDPEQQTQQEIDALRQKIAQIQEGMERKRTERDVLQTRLREAEIEIGALDQSLTEIEQAIQQELTRLLALDAKREELNGALNLEQEHLSEEIRTLWLINQGGGLRILFGDQSPDEIALNLVFFERLLTSREASLERYASLIKEADDNRQALSASQARLAAQQAVLEKQRSDQADLQAERELALATIVRSLDNDDSQVQALEADATALTDLLEEIRSALAERTLSAPVIPFSAADELLIYPTTGKPINRYGARRNASDMRWRGWMIPNQEGAEVKAIYHGQVVYADWLRGQGLLVIIDHGEGYLSLYGHNRSLLRSVGDQVSPGDVIARIGNTGGLDKPALYFEIREAGSPVDPGLWLSR
jgi:septal ring factor EnvC (AmiA/AmiB activator)